MKEQYPFNLLCDIFMVKNRNTLEEFLNINTFPKDLPKTLEFICNDSLTNRELQMIKDWYIYGITKKDIAKDAGISVMRVTQIIDKGLRKLRHPSYKEMIKVGKQKYNLEQKSSNFEDTSILNLNLSTRSRNGIMRGIECSRNLYERGDTITVKDIRNAFKDYSIIEFRNIGRKSLEEIANIIGIKDFDIDKYLNHDFEIIVENESKSFDDYINEIELPINTLNILPEKICEDFFDEYTANKDFPFAGIFNNKSYGIHKASVANDLFIMDDKFKEFVNNNLKKRQSETR